MEQSPLFAVSVMAMGNGGSMVQAVSNNVFVVAVFVREKFELSWLLLSFLGLE